MHLIANYMFTEPQQFVVEIALVFVNLNIEITCHSFLKKKTYVPYLECLKTNLKEYLLNFCM